VTQPPPEFPSDSGAYPEPSQATTVLVLGIVGLFVNIVAPFAWYLGNQELVSIDAGLRSPEDRRTANTGRILGIVGTVLLIIGILVVILALGVFFQRVEILN
jgi:Co/Zn/Cd efflux system component